MIVLALFVLVMGFLVGGAWLLDLLAGPDTDLDGWTPGDPMPGARRRPCLDSRCRIDHDKVNPWTAERGR